MYDVKILAVICPVCQASVRDRCTNPSGGGAKRSQPHAGRVNKAYPQRAHMAPAARKEHVPVSDTPTPTVMPQKSSQRTEAAVSVSQIYAERMRKTLDEAQLDYVRVTLKKMRVEKRRVYGSKYNRDTVAERAGIPRQLLIELEDGLVPQYRITFRLLQSVARAIGCRLATVVMLDAEDKDALDTLSDESADHSSAV